MKINKLQRAVLTSYESGKHLYLVEKDILCCEDLSCINDGLLTFMLIKLADSISAPDQFAAVERQQNDKCELDVALAALNIITDAIESKTDATLETI